MTRRSSPTTRRAAAGGAACRESESEQRDDGFSGSDFGFGRRCKVDPTYRRDERLFLDWIEALSIVSLAEAWPAEVRPVLITCLDSTRLADRTAASALQDRLRIRGIVTPAGIVVDRHQWAELAVARRDVFCGFDEVWFVARPPSDLTPPPCAITSETPIISSGLALDPALRVQMEAWCESTGAVLGLGDGCGLNIVAADSDWMRKVQGLIRTEPD